MKVSASQLDKVVISTINKQAQVILNADGISELRSTNVNQLQIAECKKQLYRLLEKRQLQYEQLVSGEIDRKRYHSLKVEYAKQVDRLNSLLNLFKQTEYNMEYNQRIYSLVQNTLEATETNPQREIVNAVVDKIFVYPQNHVEVLWKFKEFAS